MGSALDLLCWTRPKVYLFQESVYETSRPEAFRKSNTWDVIMMLPSFPVVCLSSLLSVWKPTTTIATGCSCTCTWRFCSYPSCLKRRQGRSCWSLHGPKREIFQYLIILSIIGPRGTYSSIYPKMDQFQHLFQNPVQLPHPVSTSCLGEAPKQELKADPLSCLTSHGSTYLALKSGRTLDESGSHSVFGALNLPLDSVLGENVLLIL